VKYLAEVDFCDLFWPRLTLSFDLLTHKVDHFMPLFHGPLVAIYIKIGSSIFKISCSQVYLDEQRMGRMEWTSRKHSASGQPSLLEA